MLHPFASFLFKPPFPLLNTRIVTKAAKEAEKSYQRKVANVNKASISHTNYPKRAHKLVLTKLFTASDVKTRYAP